MLLDGCAQGLMDILVAEDGLRRTVQSRRTQRPRLDHCALRHVRTRPSGAYAASGLCQNSGVIDAVGQRLRIRTLKPCESVFGRVLELVKIDLHTHRRSAVG